MSLGSDVARCRELLPDVSRTFALTIRALPNQLRDPITIAYLLCRLADLFEDATALDPARRIAQLELLGMSLVDPKPTEMAAMIDSAFLGAADPAGGSRLLAEREVVFRAYAALPGAEREILSRWIQAMALGMASYVGRELRDPGTPPGTVRFVLETREELRLYAYYVAGTVGHLLTELFALHLGRSLQPSLARLTALASPFGLGLQFTNILQDVAEDRRRGWSYVPEEAARRRGTTLVDLDLPAHQPAARRVIADLAREAAEYLDQAHEFTLLLPRHAPRVRLFCLWPTFFAVRTLERVCAQERVLAGKARITRQEVRELIAATSLACGWDRGLSWLYRRERARLTRTLQAIEESAG
ncbi:MAG: squalene/phytoene synthase family protein [Candidatus Eisenbacteria bacterium]|nr:squalene/phytoene synthase family protein [Candidatus Eisenbacteria bacterium]